MGKHHNHASEQELESWIPAIIMLVIFWPVGLIMLAKRFRNLSNVEVSAQRSRPLSVVGWVLMVLGILTLINGVGSNAFGAALFLGLGGMAIIAAWWGIWHIISGLTLSLLWSRRPPQVQSMELAQ